MFRLRTFALGLEIAYRVQVTEPERGRVLIEADAGAGVTTTFTVPPADDGRRCL